MNRQELRQTLQVWLNAWNNHDLEGVLALFHPDAIFESWDGQTIESRVRIRRFWSPWFKSPGGFYFELEDVFFDEREQKALFRWLLTWPSRKESCAGQTEIRRGVDLLYFQDELIIRKLTYSKTVVTINGRTYNLR